MDKQPKQRKLSFLSFFQPGKPPANKGSTVTASNDAHTTNIPELPLVIWMYHVFPFLDRKGQDSLVQAHKEVRKCCHTNDWPAGRISQEFSRPVKSIAFVGDDGSELWAACCKSHIKRIDILKGPISNSNNNNKFDIISHPKRSNIAAVSASPVDPSIVVTAGGHGGSIKLWKSDEDSHQEDHFHQEEEEEEEGKCVTKWKCWKILGLFPPRLRYLKWSPQGDKIVAWGPEGFVQVTGNLHGAPWKAGMEVAGCHETVAFAPNGLSVLLACDNDTIHQWEFFRGVKHHLILPELEDRHGFHRFISSLAFSPNHGGESTFLAVGCHVALLKIWNVVENNNRAGGYDYIYNRQINLGGGWSAVALITFSPDGRLLACTNQGSQIRIVDWQRNRVLTTLKGHTGRIESLCFTPNGRTLASAACDRTIRLWNVPSPQAACPIPTCAWSSHFVCP